jgi:P pilus assembly chaperone PapD
MNHHSASTKASSHSGWVVIFLFVFCLLTLGCNASVAGTFNISPLKITLSKNSSIAVIQLKNVGDSATTIQLQTMRRMQDGEGDKLQLTREIIATPQIFSIKAGATQLIRVGMVSKPDPVNEIAYRLVLDEIPPPPEPGFKGLQVALKINFPIFVQPLTEALGVMRGKRIRRLPVVNRAGGLVGMVTTDDLLDLLAAELSMLAGLVVEQPIKEERTRK